MPPFRLYIIYVWLLASLITTLQANAQYKLHIIPVDKDLTFITTQLKLTTDFTGERPCLEYINKLPTILQTKGYPTASIDSIYNDSTSTTIHLYLGESFKLAYIDLAFTDKKFLDQIGWNEKLLFNKPLDLTQLNALQERILAYYEKNGYPFAKIQLDSFVFKEQNIFAKLLIDKGPAYKIDSIQINGDVKISNRFMQRYLEITDGSAYNKEKLQNISKRILELPYLEELQPWSITMLGTGSVLNLYLRPKRASQINVLIGLLPSTDQFGRNKFQFTGDANINLRNALGGGETIGLNWQQLQVKSPRLNLSYQQPFLFGSLFGINAGFDLFKKDSSFLNLNFLIGLQYTVSASQIGRIFLQNFRTNLLTVDTFAIINTKQLPNQADVSTVNIGLDYAFSKTNYRNNPRKGNEFQVILSAGTRKIRPNNVITQLKDPSFDYATLYDTVKLNSYQFRIKFTGAHYFPLSKQSTLKTAANIGWIQSPSLYRNELFQIGGYKLLRGFDEESIYVSQYLVGTLEYRYLIGLNSFLFAFTDLGLTTNKSVYANFKNNYLGLGLGMAFETKAGLFNLSLAAGKSDDAKFNLRQAKIHFGYVNYF